MAARAPQAKRLGRTLVGAAVGGCFCASLALANPYGPAVVSGTASFDRSGKTLSITNTPNAIINWRGFSIRAGETTRFIQESAASAVLNRVVGQHPSAILGTLSSNGRVFLLNPNGIVFGAGSRVDVAGLVASTLNLSNQDFLAGKLNFQSGATAGSIVNHGIISTPSHGEVVLIAPNVENHGVITTPQGQTILAAGKTVQLIEADVPHLRVEIQAGGEALNVGKILADGGSAGIYAGLISQKGVVRADSASQDAAGKIVFRATRRTLLEDGSITSANGGSGGRIEITGEEVGLMGNARVEARGEKGGGTVLVGGDYQGKNPYVPNARVTYVAPGASIDASATRSGDGGKVIVWSDDTTRAHGSISVRGGASSGNGGFVETSGKRYLDVSRAPDISAPNGAAGTWLLDPETINIEAASSSNITGASPFQPAATVPATLDVTVLKAALDAGGTVIVDTTGGGTGTGDINVNTAVAKSSGPTATLQLKAHNDININQNITSSSGVLDMVFNANQDGVGGGAINLANVTLNANGGTIDASTKTVNIGAGATVESAFTIGTLNLTGGTLGGAGNIGVNTALNWSAASASTISGGGGVSVPGVLTLSGAGIKTLSNETLTHSNGSGTSTWDGAGNLRINDGSIFNNTGTFTVTGAANVDQNSGAAGNFTNSGTLTRSGTGILDIGSVGTVLFNNSSTANVTGGLLRAMDGGTHNGGSFVVLGGAIAEFQGAHDFQNATSISGSGTAKFTSGTSTISGGTMTVSGTGTALEIGSASGATLGGTGALAINAGSTLRFVQSGTLSNSGATTVAGTLDLANSGGTAQISGGGGTTVSGTLTMSGTGIKQLSDETLTHSGTAGTWDGAGNLRINDGSIFNNTGTFTVTGAANVDQNSGAAGNFTNSGTLTRSGTGILDIGSVGTVLFNNSSTANVTGGLLRAMDGGTHNGGSFVVLGGAIAEFQGAHDFQNATSISGSGTAKFTSGTSTISGGTMTVSGTGTALEIGSASGATLGGTGALAINAGSTLRFVQSGTLSNSGATTVAGTLDLANSGGTAQISGGGGTTVSGTLTMSGTGIKQLSDETLTHSGTAGTWDGAGNLRINDGSIFNNTGTFTVTGAANVDQNSGAAGNFTNSGTLTRSGTGILDIGSVGTVLFNNSSTANVTGGLLRAMDGGTHNGGSFVVLGGAIAEFQGAHDFQNATSISGSGTAKFTSGTSTISGGTMTVSGTGTALEIGSASGATLGGTGALAINAGSTLRFVQSGTLSNSGATTVAGTLDLANSGGTAQISGGGGTTVSGTLTMSGTGIKQLSDETLTHSGTAGTWDGAGNLRINDGSIFNNTGTFTVTGAANVDQNSGAAGNFTNSGTLTRSGTGILDIGSVGTVLFNNSSTANVTGGLLRAMDGGTHNGGSFVVLGGAIAEFQGAHDFQNATSISGSGTAKFTSGTSTISGGTMTVSGTGTALEIGSASGATLGGTGALAINAGSTLRFVQSGTLSNSGATTVAGTLDLANSGGTAQISGGGGTTVSGTLTMSGTGIKQLSDETLTHSGTAGTWDGAGNLRINDGSIFNNTGTFTVTGAANVDQNSGAAGNFTNSGTLTRSGTGILDIGSVGTVLFNNSSTANVTGGLLRAMDGGTHNGGSFVVLGGAIAEFQGAHDFQNATSISGSGTAKFTSGTSTISGGTMTVSGTGTKLEIVGGATFLSGAGALLIDAGSTLNFNAAELNTATITVNGTMNWTGGTMAGPGTTTIGGGGTLAISSGNGKVLGTRTLNNQGTVTQVHESVMGQDGAAINNSGSWDFQDSVGFTYGGGAAPVFNNTGTLKKTVAGTSNIDGWTLNNNAGGTLNLQTGTISAVNGVFTNAGIIDVAGGATFERTVGFTNTGAISGSGTVNVSAGTLTNNGVIRPGGAGTVGTLTVTGNYSQGAGGSLDVDLQSGASYDVLAVSGSASLAGTLNVNHLGGYTGIGNSHVVMTYASQSGTFGTVNDVNSLSLSYGPSFFALGATTNTWLFDGSDSWLNTARWSLGHVPLSSEDVIIPDYTTLFIVTIPSGPQVARSVVLQGNDIFAVNGGSFTFISPSTISSGKLAIGGGTVTANGSLAVKDLALTSGLLNGTSNVTVTNAYTGTGGSINLGGTLVITQAAGDLVLGNPIAAGALSLFAPAGAILQTAPLTIAGASSIDAGANAITLTNALNDFGGPVSLTGGASQIVDANALTLGTLNTGALAVTSNGALNLGQGTVNGALIVASNNGNITQTGGLTVLGTSDVQAGTGAITLASANDFQGLVTAGGSGGISLTDVNTLPANIINAGAGAVTLTAGTISGSGTVTASSASLFSDTDVTGLDVLIGGNFGVGGAAKLWDLTGAIGGTVSTGNPETKVILNGLVLTALAAQVQATQATPTTSEPITVCVGVLDAATGACNPPTPPPPPQVLPTPPPPAGAPPSPDTDAQAQSGATATESAGTSSIDDGSSTRRKRVPRCG